MGTMSMLNQAAVEALCSATYLENYLDCMENLPDDLQRSVSLLRELDSQTCDYMRELTHHQNIYMGDCDQNLKKRSLIQIQRALVKCQELGDEKLAIVATIIETVENRSRQLEQDLENLDPTSAYGVREKEPSVPPPPPPQNKPSLSSKSPKTPSAPSTSSSTSSNVTSTTPAISTTAASSPVVPTTVAEEQKPTAGKLVVTGKRQRRQRTRHDSVSKEEEKKEQKEKPKKKKRKTKKEKDGGKSPNIEPIDPDEPTYCLCDQVSYGEMIGCDNDDCAIEWFHFNCVGLSHKPKGKWYCPKCRGDKPTVRRQDKS